MKVLKTKLRGKEFTLAIANKDADLKTGLSKTGKLKRGAGMMFVFDKAEPQAMNMYKMGYALDMIFMDSDWKVVEYSRMHPGEDIYVDKEIRYVIEVNAGELSAVPVGDTMRPSDEALKYLDTLSPKKEEKPEDVLTDDSIDKDEDKVKDDKESKPEKKDLEVTRDDDEPQNIIVNINRDELETSEVFAKGGKITPVENGVKTKAGHMQVLDDAGVILMNIQGGERIFSREHTDQLLGLVDKVKKGKASKKELGQLMAKIVDIQNNQKPEYVYE